MLRIFKQYYPIRNIFFVIFEGIFIYISVLLASYIVFGHNTFAPNVWLMLKILLITFVCQISLYYNDLYDFKITDSLFELGIRLLQALGFAAIFIALIYLLFPKAIIAKGTFVISIGFVILIIVSWRFIYSAVLSHGLFDQKIILMGSGAVINEIRREIRERKDCGYTSAAEVPESIDDVDLINPGGVPVVCNNNFEGLSEMCQTLGIKKIIVGFKEKRRLLPIKELLKCRVEGIEVLDGNDFYENLTGKLAVSALNPGWLIFSAGFQKSHMRLLLKRLIDLILSILLMIACLPIIIITAVLIKIDSKGPVIFSQERVGEKGKSFRVHKFRSMVQDAEKQSGPVWAKNDDERITRVGRIIRKLRIDELPQLWNVLKGEMSFVGPRPEREFFIKKLEKQIPYYSVRFSVKPGITGWAQVCCGYGASVEESVEKLSYEIFYIKNMSPLMDLMIVLRTIKIVLFGRGAR
jgi:sugar transferase (PEP-CTERM system associated)